MYKAIGHNSTWVREKVIFYFNCLVTKCFNAGIEELAKFIRGHLPEIPENAQKEFERIYTKTTRKKMYGEFKD